MTKWLFKDLGKVKSAPAHFAIALSYKLAIEGLIKANDKLTIDDIAKFHQMLARDMLEISESVIKTNCKRLTGMTFDQYIRVMKDDNDHMPTGKETVH